MAMIGKIRRMYFREKKSVREISRLTSLSRNTIDKGLKAPGDVEPKYRREARECKLTPFHDELRRALKADAQRPGGTGARPKPCLPRSSRPSLRR